MKKGIPIQWNSPTSPSIKAVTSSSSSNPFTLPKGAQSAMETTVDTATTKRQKLENKSEIEDVDAEDSLEDIIDGFSDDVRAYMEQFNKRAQQANRGVRVHFPTSPSTISQYYVDGERICSGPSQDIECPWGYHHNEYC